MRIADALTPPEALSGFSDSPRLDLELLLGHVIGQSRSYFLTWPDKQLTETQLSAFNALVARRLKGEPIAYILGVQSFWTLELEVSPATLIPRPDTEVLVETALDCLPNGTFRVADLGTGTGAIALALASERPDWHVVGCDLMPHAVALAQRNGRRCGLDQVAFLQGSWFEPLDGRFELIVSNPPYIDPLDQHLNEGDVRFEPRSALVAEAAGLADITHIATTATEYLTDGGWLLFEHGYDQGEAVRLLLTQLGYNQVETRPDYAGNDRVTLGCWRGKTC